MVTRWPGAIAASTALHVAAAVLLVWIGYSMVKLPPPQLAMQLVGDGRQSFASDTTPMSGAVSVKFIAPKRVAAALDPLADDTRSAAAPASAGRDHSLTREPRAEHPTPSAARAEHPRSTMTKRDFDQQHGMTGRTSSAGDPAVRHVDTNIGTAPAVPGASGPETGAHSSYMDELGRALVAALEQIPGLDDGLRAEVEFHITPDGHLVGARLVKRSGDERFDAELLRAISALTMRPRPAGVSEIQWLPVTTRARE